MEYISRTLSSAERSYGQIDKEALSIIWAVKRFHTYLCGREFTLVSDNKPIVHIFGDKKRLPEMAASRITTWSLILMNYMYKIQCRSTAQHSNCDMLSRFPKEVKHGNTQDECTEAFALSLENIQSDAKVVARETKKDALLSKVLNYIIAG